MRNTEAKRRINTAVELKVIFIFLFMGCSSTNFPQLDNQHNYSFKIDNWKVENEGTKTFYILSTSFQNLSQDTLYQVHKACSWGKLYVTDNPILKIDHLQCEEDITLIETIPPNKSKTVVLRVYETDHQFKSTGEFRVGFFIIKENEFRANSSILDTVIISKTIWSNKISFN